MKQINTHMISKFRMIRSFSDNTFNDKTTISEADKKQNNLLQIF